MTDYFNAGQRQLQDEFDSRRLADRLQQGIIQAAINPADAEFIEAQNMFFLATVDDKGQANCSYKGGPKGLVKVVDETTLAFPIYDGNGLFLSAGNVLVNGQVGLLFIDFERQARVRVNGVASITADDELLAAWPEALFVVRVAVRETFPNCPRYIHKMALVEQSNFVPKADCETPAADWKKLEIVADVLPAKDAHLASNQQDVLAAINRN
jgi:predicted pyridoxine 5'-phosphate oxidase superfamily flavin-nucleotide-binding protein